MEQMSIWDFMPEAKGPEPGEWVAEHGRELTFDEAWKKEGRLVVLDMSTQCCEWYKVVRIEKCITYKETQAVKLTGNEEHVVSRERRRMIAYDGHKQRAMLDDIFFRDCGYCGPYPTRIYELKGGQNESNA